VTFSFINNTVILRTSVKKHGWIKILDEKLLEFPNEYENSKFDLQGNVAL